MVEIKNAEIAFLERAKRAVKNSYTVEVDTTKGDFPKAINELGSNMQPHQSHDAFLKGVCVCFDMKYNSAFMPEFQRYHWIEIVMSSGTMHCLKSMLNGSHDVYSKYVTEETKEQVKKLYNNWLNATTKEENYEAFMKLTHNLPRGFEMQCTCVTNYLALKTVVIQRFGHKQKEDWQSFISFCYSLPEFRELCGFTGPEWNLENW